MGTHLLPRCLRREDSQMQWYDRVPKRKLYAAACRNVLDFLEVVRADLSHRGETESQRQGLRAALAARTLLKEGKWWCGQHAPSAVAKRRAERDAAYARKWKIKGEQQDAEYRMKQSHPLLIAELQRLVEYIDGMPQMSQPRYNLLPAKAALKAAGKEA